MGVGAVLAFGCNIGGFFSATQRALALWPRDDAGARAGAYLGLRYLLWEVAHRPGWSRGGGRTFLQSRAPAGRRQPAAGALILALIVATLFVYTRAGYGTQGVFCSSARTRRDLPALALLPGPRLSRAVS